MATINKEFGNINEFRRYLVNNHNKPSTNGTLTRGSYKFFGTHDWTEFENYLEDGNKEVTADLKKNTKFYIDKFVEQVTETSSYQFDVVGEFFDIGAVMVGEPEAWIKEIKIEDDKFITLDIQGAYAGGTNLELVKKNGSKVFAIATVLEQQGFLVRINIHYSSNRSDANASNSRCNLTVKVKDYDSVLDYKKFGILLGVPFFRRGFLRLLEIEYGHDLADTYGYPDFGGVNGEIRLDSAKDLTALENKLMKEEE